MSQVAGWITHRYLKFAVIVFWLVVVALLGPLAGKLTGAQDNDAKSWLPANAESTEVLDVAAGFVSVQHDPRRHRLRARRPASRPTDLEAVAADAEEFGTLDTLDGEVIGPIPSEDGEAAQIIVPLDLGSDGWNLAADAVDDLRATAEDGPDGLDVYVTGPAGSAADSSAAFEGIDGTLLYAAVAVVIVILLHHLPQPDPLAPAGHLGGRRAHRLAGPHLPARGQLRPHRQRAERRHPHGPRVRRGDGLRPAARRALPRGAAQARRPARGDGPGPAPRQPGDHRVRRHGRHRHALPALRDHELDRRPRPGRGRRRRRRGARHADPAAGAAGDVRPVDLLAARPEARRRRAVRARLLGARRRPHRAPPARHVDRHVRDPRGRVPRHRRAQRDGPDHRGVVPRRRSRRSRARRCSPRTSPAAPARRSSSSRTPTRRPTWRRSSPTSRASTRRASRSPS